MDTNNDGIISKEELLAFFLLGRDCLGILLLLLFFFFIFIVSTLTHFFFFFFFIPVAKKKGSSSQHKFVLLKTHFGESSKCELCEKAPLTSGVLLSCLSCGLVCHSKCRTEITTLCAGEISKGSAVNVVTGGKIAPPQQEEAAKTKKKNSIRGKLKSAFSGDFSVTLKQQETPSPAGAVAGEGAAALSLALQEDILSREISALQVRLEREHLVLQALEAEGHKEEIESLLKENEKASRSLSRHLSVQRSPSLRGQRVRREHSEGEEEEE